MGMLGATMNEEPYFFINSFRLVSFLKFSGEVFMYFSLGETKSNLSVILSMFSSRYGVKLYEMAVADNIKQTKMVKYGLLILSKRYKAVKIIPVENRIGKG